MLTSIEVKNAKPKDKPYKMVDQCEQHLVFQTAHPSQQKSRRLER